MTRQQQQPVLINPFRKPGGTRPIYGKVGIFADSGVGKTHFCLQTPKPAVIDPERGTEWFRGRPGFSDWEVMENLQGDMVEQAHYALSFLESGFEKETVVDPILNRTIERLTHRRLMATDPVTSVQYPAVHDRETLVFDPITLLWEQIQFDQSLKAETKGRDDFSWKDHGEMKRDYKTFLNRLLQLPMHVVITARHAYERDKDSGKVVGEKMDAERSTIYAFDLAFQLVNKNGRRDAIIYKDRSRTFEQGQRVEDVSWDSLVIPILQKLQQRAPHDDALRDLVRAWRAAGVTDMAAKVIIERETGKSKSDDLTLPEIQQLTRWFVDLRAQKGGDGGAGSEAGRDEPADPADAGGEGTTGAGPATDPN